MDRQARLPTGDSHVARDRKEDPSDTSAFSCVTQLGWYRIVHEWNNHPQG